MAHVEMALALKSAVVLDGQPHSNGHQAIEEWYIDNASHKNHVSYEDITHHADKEYIQWSSVHIAIDFRETKSLDLLQWIRDVPLDELSARLAEVPTGVDGDHGLPGFEFTKFQRLSLSTWIELPFDVAVSLCADADTARALSRSSRKTNPISSYFAMIKGTVPDVSLVDFPTACGKTAWAVAAAALLTSPMRWQKLLNEFKAKRAGAIFQGTHSMTIARLVIVATAASTFEHFKTTIERSIPVWTRLWPDLNYVLWSTVSKHNSVKAASMLPVNTVVFWIIPMCKYNNVLREFPAMAVAAMISDEFTVDTPRERSKTNHSVVLKALLTQATPQALVQATRGHRSWLKDLLGGTLHAPNSIHDLLWYRSFTEAQLACDQACKLNLMSMTVYRELIRNDLKNIVPRGMDVHFVRCQVVTFAAHLLRSEVELVPADFCNVLLRYCSTLHLTNESIESIRLLTAARGVSSTELITTLCALTSRVPSINISSTACIMRLKDRVREFCSACPICWQPEQDAFKIMGCCGYVVCQACFGALSRCAFCRKNIPSAIPVSQVPVPQSSFTNVANLDSATVDHHRPQFQVGRSFDQDLAQYTGLLQLQASNLISTLHVLLHHGYVRPLIVIEKNSYDSAEHLDWFVSAARIQRDTGYNVHRVDTRLAGKGSGFTVIKKEFDDTTNPPTALLCYGMEPSFMVGTDLVYADALVVVGSISSDLITQALGRTFRPRHGRDNSRCVKVVMIYSASHAHRRRGRPFDGHDA